MSIQLGKRIYSIHKWCGLIGAVFIFILGITGSILVFNKELEAFEHKKEWHIENTLPVSIDKGYNSIIAKYPNWDVRLKRIPETVKETLIFNLRRPTQRLTVFVHPSSGAIIKTIDSNKTFVSWLLKLHYTLHANLLGEILVLVFGSIYFISLITGAIVYRNALVDMFLFRVKFRSKKKRSTASSLHRYVGVWALVLNILIVFTGAVISYEVVANGLKKSTVQPILQTASFHFSVDKILYGLKDKFTNFHPTYIRFPTNGGNPVIITGKVKGEPFYYSQYYNSVAIDTRTGIINKINLNPEASNSTKLSSIARGIHFIEFGNLTIKILFALAGLSAPLLSITGFLLWKWKQR